MAGTRGRSQREPMERIVRIAAMLKAAGSAGVSSDKLIAVAGFTEGTAESRHDQLFREIRHLTHQGWSIENIAPAGVNAVYRMTTVDNRIRVRLEPGQQAALRRAALLANRSDLIDRLGLEHEAPATSDPSARPSLHHDARLDTVMDALVMRCLLRFRYAGSARVVHPQSVRTQNGKWYLVGREADSDIDKLFVVSRMSELKADEPGTSEPRRQVRNTSLHPMQWQVDPPVEVELRAPAEHVADVRRWLGTPDAEEPDGELVRLVYTVTHRAAFRARLYQLGLRVELVGPQDIRDEVLAELATSTGGQSA